jgi:ArsR family transcriptional regulator
MLPMTSLLVVRALGALAHEHRLAIFRLLVQAGSGGMSAGVLAAQVGIRPSALSFHLKDLSHAELILARPHGRYVMYHANFVTMNQLVQYLTDNCCHGQPCLTQGLRTPEHTLTEIT